MRNKLGFLCIALGVLLLSGAIVLQLYNRAEASSAENSAQELVPRLVAQIQINQNEAIPATEPVQTGDKFVTVAPEPDYEMKEEEIDGHLYIGILSIPDLELELPIMSDWSYPKLRIAPCRYHGTVLGGDLVLVAHNYKRHFGRLSELQEGAVVTFIDVEGLATSYEVVGRDVLPPTAVAEMTAGDYDLTLFTCTYGGESRVTIYLDRISYGAETGPNT